MAESTVPGPGPAIVQEANYERVTSAAGGDGFLGTTADTSIVYGDSTGMQVKVRANKVALLRGSRWLSGDTDIVKSIGANSSGQTRIDRVVLRFNRATWLITAVVIAGTPGAGPPALTADEGPTGTFDLRAAKVTVVTGATTIAAGDVIREDVYLGEPHIVYTLATRPDTGRIGQLGFCADQPASTAPGAPAGRWEFYSGPTLGWITLTPSTVDNSKGWNGYELTVSSPAPAGTPATNRIWIQPT